NEMPVSLVESTARRLAGRSAFISGGGSGMGRAVAHRLAQEGASVAVFDVREGAADLVASEIRSNQHIAIGFTRDVSDIEAVQKAIDAAAGEFGGLDTVVTCAGIVVRSGSTESMPLDVWDKTI